MSLRRPKLSTIKGSCVTEEEKEEKGEGEEEEEEGEGGKGGEEEGGGGDSKFHIVITCCFLFFFIWISEQTENFALHNIKRLAFITEVESVYCAVRAKSLYNR
jgi:hypothetical protein